MTFDNIKDLEITLEENKDFIKNNISMECLCDQLAEEACELGQAALKLSRILRGENPTPIKYVDAINDFVEEFEDVMLVGYISNLIRIKDFSSDTIREMESKSNRWVERIKDAKQNDQE